MNDKNVPFLAGAGEGYTVIYKGKNLYSGNEPEKRALFKAGLCKFSEKTIIIAPSPLLFYGVPELRASLPPGCAVLCPEADRELFDFTYPFYDELDKKGLLPDVSYFYASRNETIKILSALDFRKFRRTKLVSLTGGYLLNRRIYDDFAEAVEDEIATFWKNKAALIRTGKRWIMNIFENLSSFGGGTSDISSLAIDRPAVIAGAGESLEYSLPLLKKYRSRISVIAVDTAARTLVISGIVPDFILAVESSFYNMADFIGVKGKNIPLILDLTSYPQTARMADKAYYFTSEFCKLNLLKELEENHILPYPIPPLGSVGIAALYIASLICRKGIFFTGIDFCYSSGRSHAKGSASHSSWLGSLKRTDPCAMYRNFACRPKFETEDKYGKKVFTDPLMSSYRGIMRKFLAGRENIFDIGCTGLESGAVLISSEEEFAGELEAVFPGHPSPVSSFRPEAAIVKNFINGALENILKIESLSAAYLNGRAEREGISELKALLEQYDFLYADFPDFFDPENFDSVKIKRVLMNVIIYRDLLKKALMLCCGRKERL